MHAEVVGAVAAEVCDIWFWFVRLRVETRASGTQALSLLPGASAHWRGAATSGVGASGVTGSCFGGVGSATTGAATCILITFWDTTFRCEQLHQMLRGYIQVSDDRRTPHL